ncbi:hypothetical protein AGDE_14028 [Angomonas deanei]|uniref:Uncharacterized protein n=1 Tax=Angomonas deanei TaxID=59799 RepID=A0A7G2CSX1_9TRYP|nr:hypothetical protein AGDE_14028 [Angomonas deanei]CAD2222916.1 hypothetical protein, conserved [Angomonas deanei]|eukprot:EPY21513.1 hypothetical protein AGDE_14028 [Angomonas deanei]
MLDVTFTVKQNEKEIKLNAELAVRSPPRREVWQSIHLHHNSIAGVLPPSMLQTSLSYAQSVDALDREGILFLHAYGKRNDWSEKLKWCFSAVVSRLLRGALCSLLEGESGQHAVWRWCAYEEETNTLTVTWTAGLLQAIVTHDNNKNKNNEITFKECMLTDISANDTFLFPPSKKDITVSLVLQTIRFLYQSRSDIFQYEKWLKRLFEKVSFSEKCRAYGTEILQNFLQNNNHNPSPTEEGPLQSLDYYLEAAQHAQEGLLLWTRQEVHPWHHNTNHDDNVPSTEDSVRQLYRTLATLKLELDPQHNYKVEKVLMPFFYDGEDYVNHCLLYLPIDRQDVPLTCQVLEEEIQNTNKNTVMAAALAALGWRSSDPNEKDEDKVLPYTTLQLVCYTLRRLLIIAVSNTAQTTLICLTRKLLHTREKKEVEIVYKRAEAANKAANMCLTLLKLHAPLHYYNNNNNKSVEELTWCYQMFIKTKWRAIQLYNESHHREKYDTCLFELNDQIRRWQNARDRHHHHHHNNEGGADADTLIGVVDETDWEKMKTELSLLLK